MLNFLLGFKALIGAILGVSLIVGGIALYGRKLYKEKEYDESIITDKASFQSCVEKQDSQSGYQYCYEKYGGANE